MLEFDPILRTRLSRFLTSDLLDDLPQSSAMTQTNQRLSSLYKTLASFLPQYVVEEDNRLMQDYGNLSPGTFMFADVSGFTALSEKINLRAGPEGIEILTRIFNDYFATMLEILAKSDGQLLKFAGDALLSFFPRTQGKDEFPKAIKAGLRMQRAMGEKFQPIQNSDLEKLLGNHDMQLTMSIGISQGKLFEALVGNISQRDHIIMGRLPGEADEAEKAGVRDEVIINEALMTAYNAQFSTKSLGEGFYQVVDNFGADLGDYEFSMPNRRRAKSSFLLGFDDDSALMADLEEQLARLEVISRFVSSEIVNKLVLHGDHIESENRLATVVFVQFTGFAELLEAWGEDQVQLVAVLLSQYYSLMQRVIATHGGVLTRSDPYALGSKLLITFGAPVSHPDDPDRAVETCLDMHKQLEQFNKRLLAELPKELHDLYPFIKQRMGITQGDVFAGEVGWRQRREYTVMGDDVNLAARLMSKAQYGQTVISPRVWNRVQTFFETEALPAFIAKGKSVPIKPFAVLGALKGSVAKTSSTPFIGRDVILLSLKMALQQAERAPKKLRVMALYGDTGVGKTRLANQFCISARSAGFKVVWVTCRTQSNRKTTWSSVVAQLLDLDLKSPLETNKTLLKEKLAALELQDIEDVLSDLLFDTGESTAGTSRPQRRHTLQATSDIFDKLSSEQTLAMSKNTLTQFRQRMAARAGNTPNWSELAMGTSLTDALLRFLSAYTQREKTLLVLDDIHKENQRALNVFKRICNELSGAKLLILTTYELTQDPKLEVHKIAVSDLPEEQTYLMASAMANSQELGARLSHFLWESTNGRALYVESLMGSLLEGDQLVQSGGKIELRSTSSVDTVPDNVRGVIISRIDRLPAEARNLLRGAAILEDDFTLPALAYLIEAENTAQIESLVENLIKLQLLEDQGNEQLGFKHGVTQQALYEGLTRLQRQKLHEKAADYLQANNDHDKQVLQAVHHLQKAGKLRQAADAVIAAGERAEQLENFDQAAEFYHKALEIFPDDPTIQTRITRLGRA